MTRAKGVETSLDAARSPVNPAQNGRRGRVSDPCEGAAAPFALKRAPRVAGLTLDSELLHDLRKRAHQAADVRFCVRGGAGDSQKILRGGGF